MAEEGGVSSQRRPTANHINEKINKQPSGGKHGWSFTWRRGAAGRGGAERWLGDYSERARGAFDWCCVRVQAQRN